MRFSDRDQPISAEEACKAEAREPRERQAPLPRAVSNPFNRIEGRVVNREAELRRQMHYRDGR
jgi:hypothetical protein